MNRRKAATRSDAITFLISRLLTTRLVTCAYCLSCRFWNCKGSTVQHLVRFKAVFAFGGIAAVAAAAASIMSSVDMDGGILVIVVIVVIVAGESNCHFLFIM